MTKAIAQEDREAAAQLQKWNGDDMALAARMFGGREDDHPYVVAFRDHRQAAEQRALAAEAREREAIRQREISDRTAQERRELADHNLRLAHEIEADLRVSEQRVGALVEVLRANSRMLSLMMPQVPINVRRNMGSEYQTLLAQTSALLPAADGGSGEKG